MPDRPSPPRPPPDPHPRARTPDRRPAARRWPDCDWRRCAPNGQPPIGHRCNYGKSRPSLPFGPGRPGRVQLEVQNAHGACTHHGRKRARYLKGHGAGFQAKTETSRHPRTRWCRRGPGARIRDLESETGVRNDRCGVQAARSVHPMRAALRFVLMTAIVWIATTAVVSVAVAAPAGTQTTGFTPLIDLGTGTYQGYEGGL